jgi:hypothetical protein
MQLSWTQARSSLQAFDLSSAAFTARVPLLTYDFSLTPSYSDLDVTRVDALVDARYAFDERLFVRGMYRYVDYADDAPYLYDTSGRNHLFAASLGWMF